MKINQSVFIRDLIIKNDFTNYNALIISIKTRLLIKMLEFNDYKETKLFKYVIN